MNQCVRTSRTCSCNAAIIYDRTGIAKTVEPSSPIACMSDSEIRTILTVLLKEWRRRRFAEEVETSRHTASSH